MQFPARRSGPWPRVAPAIATGTALALITGFALVPAATSPPAFAPRSVAVAAAMAPQQLARQDIAARTLAARRAVTASAPAPVLITVPPGGTLSTLAAVRHITWTALYQANRAAVGANPNLIQPGLVLRVPSDPAAEDAAYARHPYIASYAPSVAHATPASNSQGGSVAPVAAQSPSGGWAATAFGACVRRAENGGSYSWGTGNGGGAYQFLASSWPFGYGYGSAGQATQDAAFNAVMGDGSGASNWTPYDGCTL